MVVILTAGNCAVVAIGEFIGQIMDAGKLVCIVVCVVEKITAAHCHLRTPEVRIIDAKGIGFVDPCLLAYQEILIVAKPPPPIVSSPASLATTTSLSTATSASLSASATAAA